MAHFVFAHTWVERPNRIMQSEATHRTENDDALRTSAGPFSLADARPHALAFQSESLLADVFDARTVCEVVSLHRGALYTRRSVAHDDVASRSDGRPTAVVKATNLLLLATKRVSGGALVGGVRIDLKRLRKALGVGIFVWLFLLHA